MMSHEMSCQEIVDVVSDYLDGVMSGSARARFDEHVSGCEGCSLVVDQFRLTVWTTHRVHQDELPASLRDALLTAFRTMSRGAEP